MSRIERFKQANRKSLLGLWEMTPVLFGVLLLISLFTVFIPKNSFIMFFRGNYLTDSVTGAFLGSVLAGNPVTGYLLGKGFLDKGISLIAVTAFIVAWTTVGVIQFPAESLILGKRFAIARNVSAYFMSIIVAIVTVIIVEVL